MIVLRRSTAHLIAGNQPLPPVDWLRQGVVHDLAKLVGSSCVISTGVSYIMSIDDWYALNGPQWVTCGGHFYNSCEDLAKDISDHADDPDVEITVHKF